MRIYDNANLFFVIVLSYVCKILLFPISIGYKVYQVSAKR
jgi:hypothetical protein